MLNKLQKIILILIVFSLVNCSEKEEQLKIIDSILYDKDSDFFIDTKNYPSERNQLPIGIFDSGTGGLTVMDAIVNFDKYNNQTNSYNTKGDSIKDFIHEKFIYLADQANMPYGNYNTFGKSELLKEHVLKDAQFLLGNKYYQYPTSKVFNNDKQPVKVIVIACNTATAYAKEELDKFIEKSDLNLKIIGVIGAGVKAALSGINYNNNLGIAIMATVGTVSSNGYVNEINKQLNENNYNGNVSIFQQAGYGLAEAIDDQIDFIDRKAIKTRKVYKGPSDLNKDYLIDKKIINRYGFDWTSNNMLYEGTLENPYNIQINSVNNYINYHITSLLEQIIKKAESIKLKKVILGCTHYPFFSEKFIQRFNELFEYKENDKYIYRNILDKNVELIDPAIFTAKELYEFLAKKNLFNNSDIYESEFYISTPNYQNENVKIDSLGNFPYEYKYSREVNEIQQYVKIVPFSKKTINDEISSRLESIIPFTYELIRNFNIKSNKTQYLPINEKL